jgi:HNH endonuclease
MLTQERLKSRLHYDPETGVFQWLATNDVGKHLNAWNAKYAGTIAGTISKYIGYITINIDGEFYYAHRLAWFYVYSEWPKGQIDHIDRDRTHNWIANLRQATQQQQSANCCVKKSNKSGGHKGASLNRNGDRWRARIMVDGREIHLGTFDSPEEAHAVYIDAARKAFGEFARGE